MEALYDKIGKMEIATKLAIWLGVQAIVGATYFFGFYKDISDQRGRLESEMAVEKKNLKEAEKKLAAYRAIKNKVDKLKHLNERLARSLPEESHIPLGEIHKRAEAAGVQLSTVTRKEEEETSVYARIPIAIVVKGSYHRVMEFFWKLGQMDRIVKISNIKIAKPMRKEGDVIVEVSCEAATFRYLAKGGRSKKGKGSRRR